MLKFGPITIGKRCFIGAESVLRPFTKMEDDSRLGNLSMLPEGATIPSGEEWVGSPARPLSRKEIPADSARPEPTARAKRVLFGALYGLGIFLLPLVYLVALFPGIILMNYLCFALPGLWFVAASPVVATIFILFVCLEITLVKRLLLGTVKAGTYALSSWFHVRKWFVDQLMEISLEIIGPLYASLYLPPWFRLLGAKMGRNAEISTAAAATPDLLNIDDESFIADSAFLGAPHIDKGQVTIGVTRLGKRAFIGNSALIPSGSAIGDGSLIGVLSTPPLGVPGASAPSTSWVGSPAIFLPQRQTSKSFSEETTYRPTRKLYFQRLFIEFFRIILPATFFTLLASLMIYGVIRFHQECSTLKLILVFPVLYAGCALAAALVVIAFKWLLMGRYKPDEKPLWSTFVWKNELVTALYEHLAGPFMFDLVEGTPFFGWLLRLLGTKVGKRVYFETTEFTEFDLVKIGDDVTLNVDCTIQTHLFEDRVMKMSTVEIGDGCSVGTASVVLYDTKMHDGASLSDLSLLMKGETLPASTRWEGTPARKASDVSPLSIEPVLQTQALASPSTVKKGEPVKEAYRPDDDLLDVPEIGILAAQHD
jgi:non-ribosomal peptide synthetase-like protein